MGNKSHSTPISIFMVKHITFPVVLNTDIISKYSSSKVGNIWPVCWCISASLAQHLMMCLACTPYLIHTDDALHLYQKCSLVLMISSLVLHILAHIAHTPYRVHIDKKILHLHIWNPLSVSVKLVQLTLSGYL